MIALIFLTTVISIAADVLEMTSKSSTERNRADALRCLIAAASMGMIADMTYYLTEGKIKNFFEGYGSNYVLIVLVLLSAGIHTLTVRKRKRLEKTE